MMTVGVRTRCCGLVVVGLLLCLALASPASATERALEITEDRAQPSEGWLPFDTSPLDLHDFDGDGAKEIVALNENRWVYVFDSRSGEILFEAETNVPSYWEARPLNGPEAAVVDEEGTQKVFVANSAAVVTSFRYVPSASTADDLHFEREWERRLNTCHDDPGMDAKPVLADVDQDGQHEILLTTEEVGFYVLEQDGATAWKHCVGGGNASPTVADLDRDGSPEIVYGNDAGLVAAFDGATGDWRWSYDATAHHDLGAGSIPVQPAVGQLDGQGGPDVVVGARDSHAPDDWDANHAILIALDHEGDELWSFQHPDGNPLTYTVPVIADIDENGRNEVFWADWNTVGHKPPWGEDAWQRTGPAQFYRLNADGSELWTTSLGTWWNNKDTPLADVDGDGEPEVLANAPGPDGWDAIWYLDAHNGGQEEAVSLYPWNAQRAPVVADLWGEGTMQWVIAASPSTADAGGHALLVYDTGQPYQATWPAMPEHELGAAGEATTGSTDSFAPTFRISSPNEWWQELYLETERPAEIADAEVRIDGGSWHPMDERDWGAWTSSFHAPEGSQVEFRATDAGGATAVSEPFTWLDGDDTQPTTDGSTTTSGEQGVSFDVGDSVNEWWVEVYLDADATVEAVDVRVDGSDWEPLAATDWGSWAKSTHVPSGSAVEFRATTSTGTTATSQTYPWLSDGFQASFDVADGANDWWVEVFVSSEQDVQSVDARVNGDEWRSLERTDWGSWADSFHAPSGSSVEFRATSTSGATTLSQTYTWP